jgi:protein-export membrane protein SecD
MRIRIIALVLLLVGAAFGWFVYSSQHAGARFPFRLGLDLAGGSHLVYQADTTSVAGGDVAAAMASLRDVVERRVNLFGVSEPVVQTEDTFSGDRRLIVELPGVTDVNAAIAIIGKTPQLEFRLQQTLAGTTTQAYVPTGVTGSSVQRAQLSFQSSTGGSSGIQQPVVVLYFNTDGAKLFDKVTKDNVGKVLGIFLDGAPISLPVIQQEIPSGQATITGHFTPEEAKQLVRDLNYGALPLPISLVQTASVGPSLGAETFHSGVKAGVFGFFLVALFMVLWYRVPGLIAVIAFTMYAAVVLALFKLVPVTLTAAGIAAFILSVGMAVDANILIFERMKEEMRKGKNVHDAIQDGFKRAWPSIRDSNISSMITAIILFWFGTSLIKGFALVFGLGVLISMITAISVSRTFLLAIGGGSGKLARALFGSGMHL